MFWRYPPYGLLSQEYFQTSGDLFVIKGIERSSVGGLLGTVSAPFLRTPYRQPVLALLFNKERRIALRAFLRDRLIPKGKRACRIVAATVKCLPFPAPPLHNHPFAPVLGAPHPCLPGPRRFTGWVIRTSEESAKLSVFDHHRTAALLTAGVGFLFLFPVAVHLPCKPALRVRGTGQKVTSLAPPLHHL